MAYVPNNQAIFIAAYAGALAGMGVSDRVPTDNNPSDYSGLAEVAGAFAQCFDQLYPGPVNTLSVLTVEEICETAWQERSPNAQAPFLTPATYTPLCNALIAILQAGLAYFTAQGVSPNVPGGGSITRLSRFWYVDGGTTTPVVDQTGSIAAPFSTIQGAINAIPPPISLVDAQVPVTIFISPFIYDEDVVYTGERNISLVSSDAETQWALTDNTITVPRTFTWNILVSVFGTGRIAIVNGFIYGDIILNHVAAPGELFLNNYLSINGIVFTGPLTSAAMNFKNSQLYGTVSGESMEIRNCFINVLKHLSNYVRVWDSTIVSYTPAEPYGAEFTNSSVFTIAPPSSFVFTPFLIMTDVRNIFAGSFGASPTSFWPYLDAVSSQAAKISGVLLATDYCHALYDYSGGQPSAVIRAMDIDIILGVNPGEVIQPNVIIFDSITAIRNLTLPFIANVVTATMPAGILSRDYTIKNLGPLAITITPSGIETINGVPGPLVVPPATIVRLVAASGVDWQTL